MTTTTFATTLIIAASMVHAMECNEDEDLKKATLRNVTDEMLQNKKNQLKDTQAHILRPIQNNSNSQFTEDLRTSLIAFRLHIGRSSSSSSEEDWPSDEDWSLELGGAPGPS